MCSYAAPPEPDHTADFVVCLFLFVVVLSLLGVL